ncbi:MAG TPA: universal stress protein [Thermoplasmatales archaeon]|nr:universal stress protein [Thermoplasmatales archaeon]
MKRILVGYDGSDGAEKALNRALELIEEDGELILLAVIPSREEKSFVDSDAYKMVKLKADEMIRKKIEEIGEKSFSIRGIIEKGDAADKIIEVANRLNCDLIILGRKGQSEIRPDVLGSVAEKVVTHAYKPVMIVR